MDQDTNWNGARVSASSTKVVLIWRLHSFSDVHWMLAIKRLSLNLCLKTINVDFFLSAHKRNKYFGLSSLVNWVRSFSLKVSYIALYQVARSCRVWQVSTWTWINRKSWSHKKKGYSEVNKFYSLCFSVCARVTENLSITETYPWFVFNGQKWIEKQFTI